MNDDSATMIQARVTDKKLKALSRRIQELRTLLRLTLEEQERDRALIESATRAMLSFVGNVAAPQVASGDPLPAAISLLDAQTLWKLTLSMAARMTALQATVIHTVAKLEQRPSGIVAAEFFRLADDEHERMILAIGDTEPDLAAALDAGRTQSSDAGPPSSSGNVSSA